MQNKNKTGLSLKIISVLFLAIFLIIFNPYNFFSPVRNLLQSIFMPLIQVGYKTGNKVGDIFDTIKSIGTFKQDNENLSKENLELKSKINELKDIKNENEQLRKELDFKKKQEFKTIGAEVILKDISGKNNWVEINLGSDDGIKKDMPVIVGEKNLIGFTSEVFSDYSRVNLINNPENVFNVKTIESNTEAIARGEYGISILVEKINKDANVEVGMTFITSQLSGKFPQGLTAGVVQDVFNSPDGLYKNARIKPLADLNNLRFVFVVMK